MDRARGRPDAGSPGDRAPRRDPVAVRVRIAVLFAALLLAFAIGVWGTVLRPPAYEVRGVLVARPSPGMILVRHDAVAALGMSAMETMAIVGEPAVIDHAGVVPGDRVRLGVRQRDAEIALIRIEKLP